MAIINWPCSLIRPLHTSFFIQWTTREAGVNMHGIPQIIDPGIGMWRVSITLPLEMEEDRLKQIEAKVSQMRGRANIANLCICDPYGFGAEANPKIVQFTDNTWFTDGTGFSDPEAGSEPIFVRQNAGVGDSAVVVDLADPPRGPLRVGDFFSVNGFLYRVVERNNNGWMAVEPPLREDILQGTQIQTDPPNFYGRFIDDGQGMRSREYLRYGSQVTITFLEVFQR